MKEGQALGQGYGFSEWWCFEVPFRLSFVGNGILSLMPNGTAIMIASLQDARTDSLSSPSHFMNGSLQEEQGEVRLRSRVKKSVFKSPSAAASAPVSGVSQSRPTRSRLAL